MKYLPVCFLFYISFSFCFAQNVDVVYKLQMKPDTLNKDYIEKDFFTLNIRGNTSKFYSDSFLNLMNNQENSGENGIDLNKISSNYIVTIEERKTFHYLPVYDQYYKYEDKEKIKWEIGDSMSSIDSLSVRLAQTSFRGRDWTVWFTDEIPIPEGPYKFKGLPGLILIAHSGDGDYEFVFQGLKLNDEEIEFPPALLINSREKFLEILDKFAKNPSRQLVPERMNKDIDYEVYVEGRKVEATEEARLFNNFVWEFMKQHNNPIEKDEVWIR